MAARWIMDWSWTTSILFGTLVRVLNALAGQGWSVAESEEGALPAPEPQAG